MLLIIFIIDFDFSNSVSPLIVQSSTHHKLHVAGFFPETFKGADFVFFYIVLAYDIGYFVTLFSKIDIVGITTSPIGPTHNNLRYFLHTAQVYENGMFI